MKKPKPMEKKTTKKKKVGIFQALQAIKTIANRIAILSPTTKETQS